MHGNFIGSFSLITGFLPLPWDSSTFSTPCLNEQIATKKIDLYAVLELTVITLWHSNYGDKCFLVILKTLPIKADDRQSISLGLNLRKIAK